MTHSTIAALKARARGISLGLYAADLGDLRGAAVRAADWGCGVLHFDEMDGNFVPGMVGGPGLVSAAGAGAEQAGPLRDVHLMVQQPQRHVAVYVKAGADMITVHAEAENPAAAIAGIRQAAAAAGRPVLAGVALMPGTTVDQIGEVLAQQPDMILILSLDPRDGAAPDITKAIARLADLRQRLPGAVMAFDGGVTAATIKDIAAARPDMIVSGSAVMKAADPARAFQNMQDAWHSAWQGIF